MDWGVLPIYAGNLDLIKLPLPADMKHVLSSSFLFRKYHQLGNCFACDVEFNLNVPIFAGSFIFYVYITSLKTTNVNLLADVFQINSVPVQ